MTANHRNTLLDCSEIKARARMIGHGIAVEMQAWLPSLMLGGDESSEEWEVDSQPVNCRTIISKLMRC